eukprot:scaffold6459_cov35-Phaeocystis_antarctica.AAC.1
MQTVACAVCGRGRHRVRRASDNRGIRQGAARTGRRARVPVVARSHVPTLPPRGRKRGPSPAARAAPADERGQ